MTFVLDASAALSWCFEDELTAESQRLFVQLSEETAMVPSIWALEVANSLLVAERRQRQSRENIERYVRLVVGLPISVDGSRLDTALTEIRQLARDHNLSAYDASYLELAVRRGLPLATLDERLRRAATEIGVSLL